MNPLKRIMLDASGTKGLTIIEADHFDETLDQPNARWAIFKAEAFKEAFKKIGDRAFLGQPRLWGVRPSNLIVLSHNEYTDRPGWGTCATGGITAIDFDGSEEQKVAFDNNVKNIFLAQREIVEYENTRKKLKMAKEKHNEAKKAGDIEGVEKFFRKINSLASCYQPNIGYLSSKYSFSGALLCMEILYADQQTLIYRKTDQSNYNVRLQDLESFCERHQDILSGQDLDGESFFVSKKTDSLSFPKVAEEREGDISQIHYKQYMEVLAEEKEISTPLLPLWESTEVQRSEVSLSPLGDAHLTYALNSGVLQGDIKTDDGDAIIKGSTMKIVEEHGMVKEERLVNQQMVFYKDTYSLVHEKSSAFLENNLEELSNMLKGMGTLTDSTDLEEMLPIARFLAKQNRPDLPGQVVKTHANFVAQRQYGFSIYNGEPGIGKTQVAFSVAHLLATEHFLVKNKGFKTLFFADGSKHLRKMVREANQVIGAKATVKVIRTKADIDAAISDAPQSGEMIIYVLSKDTAKRCFSLSPVKNINDCPKCGASFTKKGTRGEQKLHATRGTGEECSNCSEKLLTHGSKMNLSGNFSWGESGKAFHPSRVKTDGFRPTESLGKYARRIVKWKKVFDFFIVDEAHNMSNDGTAQTESMKDFIKLSRKVMLMTGTLSNGYASSLYYLLFALMPARMKEWGFDIAKNGLVKFIDSYGARKWITSQHARGLSTRVAEKAVINPSMIMHHLAPFTVWGKITDLNYPMPKYSESVEVTAIEPEILELYSAIVKKATELKNATGKSSRGMMAPAVAKALMYISNNPCKPYTITLRDGGVVYGTIEVPALFDEGYTTFKEAALMKVIEANERINRPVMVYTYFNNKALTNERLRSVIERELPDISVAVLPSSIKSEKIEEWFESASKKYKVVLVPYKRVATGLDIPQYPEVVFYEEEYNIREIIQASRRPYRAVVQTKPVHVTHLVQDGVQATAMSLISQKITASKVVEGDVYSEEGVESFTMDSIEIELCQRLASGIESLMRPDFASVEVPAGRNRPWTKLEKLYIEMVAEYNPSAMKAIAPESVDDLSFDEEELVAEEDIDCVTEDIEIAKKPEIVEVVDNTTEDEELPVEFKGYIVKLGQKARKFKEHDKIFDVKNIKEDQYIQLALF